MPRCNAVQFNTGLLQHRREGGVRRRGSCSNYLVHGESRSHFREKINKIMHPSKHFSAAALPSHLEYSFVFTLVERSKVKAMLLRGTLHDGDSTGRSCPAKIKLGPADDRIRAPSRST